MRPKFAPAKPDDAAGERKIAEQHLKGIEELETPIGDVAQFVRLLDTLLIHHFDKVGDEAVSVTKEQMDQLLWLSGKTLSAAEGVDHLHLDFLNTSIGLENDRVGFPS